jgi:hypothetical protein
MGQMGLDVREVFGVLDNPQLRMPAGQGEERLNGYGLTCIVRGETVVSVGIDGATKDNWEEWARERALFSDGAKIPTQFTPPPVIEEEPETIWAHTPAPRKHSIRRRTTTPTAGALRTTHILDDIHPALRDAITAQVNGDFSRLVVHSPTKVEILPQR